MRIFVVLYNSINILWVNIIFFKCICSYKGKRNGFFMLDNSIKEQISAICSTVSFDCPMSKYTTFRIGGNADCLAVPSSKEEVLALLRFAKENSIEVTVLGNCSNVLVRDGGIDGITILINSGMTKVEIDGETVKAQAGITMSSLAQMCIRASLSGFEFASGIPGCLGGGIYMNAGAYNGEIGNIVQSVDIIDEELNFKTLTNKEMGFAYRNTALSGRNVVVLGGTLKLKKGCSTAIAEQVADYAKRRRDRQPLTYPSAGSTFKRPEGAFAAALIDQAGLKGLTVGGAQVSTKHAGFFINIGGATAADVLELISKVQQIVFENNGIMLQPEVKIIGRD